MASSTDKQINDPLLRKRLHVPDVAEDENEHKWWNSNADLIDRIWANDGDVRDAVRTGYLETASRFLVENNGSDTFLFEIGSGSGWVGQALVRDTRTNLLGIDLSEAQVEIAQQNAKAQGLDAQCTYVCANLSEVATYIPNAKAITGVVIHAILHHLTWSEIDNVLAETARQAPAAKLFVYEPVFFPEGAPAGFRRGSGLSRQLAVFSSLAVLFSMRVFGRLTAVRRDSAVLRQIDIVSRQAQENQWVLSPKEVVFGQPELISALGKSFRVQGSHLCNYLDLNAAQSAALLKGPGLVSSVYTRVFLPALQRLDRWLVSSGAIFDLCNGKPRNRIVEQHFPRYCFWGVECQSKR